MKVLEESMDEFIILKMEGPFCFKRNINFRSHKGQEK